MTERCSYRLLYVAQKNTVLLEPSWTLAQSPWAARLEAEGFGWAWD